MCDDNSTVSDVMISSSDLAVMKVVINTGLSFILVVVALVSTVVNLLVFYRMGYRDTVNVIITSIGCCDVVKLLCAFGILLYGPVGLASPATGISWEQCTFPQVVFIHLIFAVIAYVIAGYMSVERCLYVSMPVKVKTMLTPKVTTVIVLAVTVGVFITLSPMLFIFRCEKSYSHSYQSDVYCYNYSDFYYSHGRPYLTFYRITNITYPLVSLICMVTSTTVIAKFLYKRRSRHCGSAENQLKMTTRDQQVIKMLMVTIVVYIACTVPRLAHFIAMLFDSRYYFLQRYHNMYWCLLYLVYFLDYFNAASHFPIFYYMGSNYRNAFTDVFCQNAKRKTFHVSGSTQNVSTDDKIMTLSAGKIP